MNRNKAQQLNEVTDYMKVTLAELGMKKGVDYHLTSSQILFRKFPNNFKKERFTKTVAQVFPQYCFVWYRRMLFW